MSHSIPMDSQAKCNALQGRCHWNEIRGAHGECAAPDIPSAFSANISLGNWPHDRSRQRQRDDQQRVAAKRLAEKRLSKLHQPNYAPIPQTALVRIERLLDRLELVLRQIKAVEAAPDEVLTKAAPANEAENTILAPARLRGIGPGLATLLVREAYVRPLRNRRALGAYLAANFPYRRRPARARSNCVNCAPG
jgi:hypothetical protein